MLLVVLACSCVTGHFEEVARATVPAHGCGQTGITVTKIHWWAYQVDACGEVSYARCWYKPHSGNHTQCCRPSTEDKAHNLNASEELFEQGAVCRDYEE